MPTAWRECAWRSNGTSLIAPRWHTAALVLLIVGVAAFGTALVDRSQSIAQPPRGIVAYLLVLLVQWGLVLYVTRVGRPRSVLGRLIGQRWDTGRRAAIDLALAALVAGLILTVERVWLRRIDGSPSASVAALLPASRAERAAWALVATSVGFCEEVVYRGYLPAQLTAFTRSAPLGVVLSALLFGIAHADQGVSVVLRFAFYGVLLGVLARARRSLLPGMACHIGIDLAAGLLAG